MNRAVCLLLLAPALFAAGPCAPGQDKDEKPSPRRPSPVPICTSILQLEPGQAGPAPARPSVRVKVRYRAVSLSRKTLETIRTNPRAQAFFNARVLRRLLQFTTDVPLKVGRTVVKPGTHDAGFACLGERQWRFVVIDKAGKELVSQPLVLTRGEAEIPSLNVSLVPGAKDNRLRLAARYGTLRGTVEMERVVEEKE